MKSAQIDPNPIEKKKKKTNLPHIIESHIFSQYKISIQLTFSLGITLQSSIDLLTLAYLSFMQRFQSGNTTDTRQEWQEYVTRFLVW